MATMENTEQPLIAYADFSDYLPIIERGDNWNRIFKAVFNRRTDVQQSLSVPQPDLYHARPPAARTRQ
jgi:hypothetical protein